MPACIAIMAGGTGGHVFPALAVADALRARGFDVFWLGTERGLEARLVPAAGIALHTLTISGLRGKGVLGYAKLPLALVRSVIQALRWMRVLRPVCVLGMGGYAAGPGGVAAFLSRIPLVVHEQNAVAGMTNRCLAPLAARVLTAYPNQLSVLPKARVVGNPLRGALCDLPPPATRYAQRTGPVRILVLGGSLGAQALNTAVPQALGLVHQVGELPFRVWHQAGRDKVQATLDAYAQAQLPAAAADSQESCGEQASEAMVCVSEFITDMAKAYAWADFVICRSGALTVSEIALVGLPAVFIPFPHAVDDHQTRNADFLVSAGAAKCFQQSELKPESFAQSLSSLLQSRADLQRMAERAHALGKPQATAAVVEAILALIPAEKRRP